MKIIDNKNSKFGDDLKREIRPNSKIQMCASIFSMYGFEILKEELSKIESMQFIFTNPTFINSSNKKKEFREFELGIRNREKSIFGSEFEVKLKNELNGKAIAKECAKWIEEKVQFKSNINNKRVDDFTNIEQKNGFFNKESIITYLNTQQFDSAGLGYESDDSLLTIINKIENDYENSKSYIDSFNRLWNEQENFKDVTDEVLNFISDLYKENSPEFIYYVTLYNIFSEFLEDINEEELADERVGFKETKIWHMLYDFQKEAVYGIINKLNRHNGCILADSVGLGKTFTALGVIKYFEKRNLRVLVLCPKKLSENWNRYRFNYKDNILKDDKFEYDVLFHTDLTRDKGDSNGMDLSKIQWDIYNLIVIDESHNFRNNNKRKDKETRYSSLMNKVINEGTNTKVLMLSATPVNNRFSDLKNQLAFAYGREVNIIDEKISEKPIDYIIRDAQTIFNEWSKLPKEERTTEELLNKLSYNFDFFKLLDSVTIARSRKHIKKYYNMDEIGSFPHRLPPINKNPEITNLENFMTIEEISNNLTNLKLCYYSPFEYIKDDRITYYANKYDTYIKHGRLTFSQADREKSLKVLMRINLLKRLESSIYSFRKTLKDMKSKIEERINDIEKFERYGIKKVIDEQIIDEENIDIDIDLNNLDDLTEEDFIVGEKIQVNLGDINISEWKRDLLYDLNIFNELYTEMLKVNPDNDTKLKELLYLIDNKVNNPINENNRKVIVFSAFADTIDYLYDSLNGILLNNYHLNVAKITGKNDNKCTLNIDKDFNNLLTNFSPKSRYRNIINPNETTEIDILFATDCISEGQNLQDCDYLINYDIHWNPVRIIQRFGRIDRIGSENDYIQLVNFWPNMNLDDYINLRRRVEDKMLISDLTATGDDNLLTNESSDIEFRTNQLKKMRDEVIDLEDINTGVSITDLGLNDFRMDLVEYVKKNGNLDKVPNGLHSVVYGNADIGVRKGVIYVLKNINSEINIDNMNQLHPFYLVYIGDDGTILSNHLSVKRTLDVLRGLSKGNSIPIKDAYNLFNEETDDGKNMIKYSNLLNKSIESIINLKGERDLNSLFKSGGTSMLINEIKGLDDFELITFMVVV